MEEINQGLRSRVQELSVASGEHAGPASFGADEGLEPGGRNRA
jgi:hypothetical protein